MKPLIPLAVALFAALACTTAQGAAKPTQSQPNPPRTIMVSSRTTPPVIHTALLESTLIVLPRQEEVASVFAGDTVDWVIDGGRVPSRFLSVKPKLANIETDIHIISNHGNEYTLELSDDSRATHPHFDSKVYLVPAGKAAKERLLELPVFVPASELKTARQEVAAAKAAEASALKADLRKEAQFRGQYPGTLRFDYTWNKRKGKTLGLREIWHDARFTYLRGHFEDPPALYQVQSGKPSLINYTFFNGLYTVPQELKRGYLVIGKDKVEFHQTGSGD